MPRFMNSAVCSVMKRKPVPLPVASPAGQSRLLPVEAMQESRFSSSAARFATGSRAAICRCRSRAAARLAAYFLWRVCTRARQVRWYRT